MTIARRVFVFSREYPPTTVGGTSTVARNLSVGLTAEKWEVVVITARPHERDDLQERLDGVLVHRAATDLVYNSATGLTAESLRVHRRLHATAERHAIAAGAPDLVVLPDLFCYPEAAMFARRHNVALLNILLQDFRAITPYDRDTHQVTTGVSADRAHLLDLERKAVQGSDHTVFISEALSEAVNGYYPDNQAPHSVIHLGVDAAEIRAVDLDPKWQRLKNALVNGTGQPLLVACGRLVPVKGFHQLLSALSLLGTVRQPDDRTVAPHLVLVGVGPEGPRLRQHAAELGLASRVSFLGDVPRREALGWMSVADIAVVPSLWESFCYVCAEMMAFGRPVVATAVDSLCELIPSAEFGYPVPVTGPSGNRTLAPEDLADALRGALHEPAEAGRRGAAARDRIAARFTNDRFARLVSALGHEMTAGPGR